MLVTKTIRIDDELHKVASDHAKDNSVRGGFSAYIESLVRADLIKKGKIKKEGK